MKNWCCQTVVLEKTLESPLDRRKSSLTVLQYSWASLVAQLIKNPPATWETWVQSLGWEDPLEKGKATHSSTLAWRIPWTVQSRGSQRVGQDWTTFAFTSIRRTDAKALILWPPDAKSQLIAKDPDAGQDWGQEEKGATEEETFGWHHRANARESEKTLGDSKEQGSPASSVHGIAESDMT